MVELNELLDNGRGRRRADLTVEKRRSLTIADLSAEAVDIDAYLSPLKQLRSQHHKLARLIAEGKRLEETCLITGYSLSYVSNLKNDPSFKGLVAYYEQQVDEIFIDVQERLKDLGISSVEELQDRLATSPERFSSRELMELAELCFDRAGHGKSHTVNNNVAILSLNDLERVKRSLGSSGKVRDISDHQRIEMGGAIDAPTARGYETDPNSTEGHPVREADWKEAGS